MNKTSYNLWDKITATSVNALEKKALKPILTNYEVVKDTNLDFVVRILDNIQRKEKAKKKQKKYQNLTDYNPFLPYEDDLYVTDLEDTHICILNKYNVVKNHVLIITRDFQPQENLLNLKDLESLWFVLKQIKGLGFYNAGALAGASQPHKHLQVIPFPFVPNCSSFPIDNLVLNYQDKIKAKEVVMVDQLPYQSAIAFHDTMDKSAKESAKITLELYQKMLDFLGIDQTKEKTEGNYNFLITKQWLMIIPRRKPKALSISVNSLGFAGALLVKDEEQLAIIKEHKPLHILTEVGLKK
jgi:ATP adenylyltransferase